MKERIALPEPNAQTQFRPLSDWSVRPGYKLVLAGAALIIMLPAALISATSAALLVVPPLKISKVAESTVPLLHLKVVILRSFPFVLLRILLPLAAISLFFIWTTTSRRIMVEGKDDTLKLDYVAPRGSGRDPVERFAFLLYALVELWYACRPKREFVGTLSSAENDRVPKGVKFITVWWILFVLVSLFAFALSFSLRRATSNPSETVTGSIMFFCLYAFNAVVLALGSVIIFRIGSWQIRTFSSKKGNN